jgi:radical SAM superfamily enzyme with C-terminal helix-hairpin-helix motif
MAPGDPAATIHDLIDGGIVSSRWRHLEEWNRWMLLGARMAREHPDFPDPLMVEVETYRGCLRYGSGGCSFCVEPLKGRPLFREVEDILEEVSLLRELGVHNFRLGAQTCFISYMAHTSNGEIVPDPSEVESLLGGISSLGPRVLHLDNANPAVIASRPEESMEILRHVVRHCTGGNVLALGMESADPAVIEANNLNSTPDQVMTALRMINEAGRERGGTGLPMLLPGLNFIVGLEGEDTGTLERNIDFLREVMSRDLLLRRVNIRQVMNIRRDFHPAISRSEFLRFKERVRNEIDRPMLEGVIPTGTVLKDVFLELREGNRTFGRQVASYPILVGFNYPLEVERFVDAAIVGWGSRSATAVEYPLRVNSCPMAALSSLPGVGQKRSMRLIRARPLKGMEDLELALVDPSVAASINGFLEFETGEPY